MFEIGFSISTYALGLVGLILWVLNLLRVSAGEDLIEWRNQRGIPFGFLDLILLYFLMAAGNLVPSWWVCQSLGIEIGEISNLHGDALAILSFANAAGLAIGITIALGIYRLRYGRINLFGDIPLNLSRDVVLGLAAGVMVIPVILLFQAIITSYIPYKHATLEMLEAKPSLLVITASWFSAVIVAPICEEIIFRGILQSWLQRIGRGVYDCLLIGGWDSIVLARNGESFLENENERNPAEPWSRRSNSYWPMAISSLLFGLMHYGQGPAPYTLFLFGMVLGYLYYRTGSITSCILVHMMLNGFTMFWFTLQIVFGDAPSAASLE